jgi:hypothetical protein
VCMEHGIAGQTVFHAHLHLLPLGVTELPTEILRHPDLRPVAGWGSVQEYLQRHGFYFYLAVGNRRFVLPSSLSPAMGPLRDLVATSAALEVGPRGLIKKATAADIDVLVARWLHANAESQHVL